MMASPCDMLPPVRGSLTMGAALKDHVWFRAGGPAEILFRPADADDLASFLAANAKDLRVSVIGVGSNLLVRDGGISGVVVRLSSGFGKISTDGLRVRAGAAALDSAVAGRQGVQRVRLTLDEAGRHEAVAAPLEPNPLHWTYAIAKGRVLSTDLLQRHKTSWRGLYEETGMADEMLFLNERGELAEGARSNIFVARDGMLLTPPLSAGVLDGRLRAEFLEAGKAQEATLTPSDLKNAEVYLGNSLRGLIRALPL